ncbi:Nif3-like dinuclear metal center hexameric protein [Haloimpatiens massiliensis]|uniref:Nif3-like dinuclear metal center hexameric protein n=1 Tax=Haloimpatiens massiliensis TaxID=1658110 RepID=UPI000C866835|nr:Nif3-like dinuclear metal center hexameric protein [Haloimpatiens massiliensis]
MSLKVKDIEEIMENYAPSKFKESYDNVGLMVGDKEDEIKGILIALDCTLKVIEEAKEKGCNLILTHHPLIFNKPSSITKDTLQGRKIIELIKNNLNLFSSHTNLDSVYGGLNSLIMKKLGFEDYSTMELSPVREPGDNVTGVGRLAILNEAISIKDLCRMVKNKLRVPFIRYTGDENWKVDKIAVINGSGEDFFSISKKLGAQCIITGDTTYHYASDYTEEGISIIDVGHFETEWPAFKMFGELIQEQLKEKAYNVDIIISEKTSRVYKFK